MKELKVVLTKTMMLAGMLVAFPLATMAQEWGSSTPSADTTKVDSIPSTPDASGSYGGWEDPFADKKNEPQAPVRIPYKRFVPPYDSLREIIFYEGIVREPSPEEANVAMNVADSFYWRAKKFLIARYGKENVKKWTFEDKATSSGGKMFSMTITIPMIVRSGESKKVESGQLEFKLTMRFTEDKYKYQFGNFVHIETPNGLGTKPTRTYHEYYMKQKRGYEMSDKYLLAADREVKEVVDGLRKRLRAPYQPDEDAWEDTE